MKRLLVCSVVVVTAIGLCAVGVAERPATLDRNEIDDAYKWDLCSIYADWQAWEADLETTRTAVDTAANRRGTLAKGADALADAFGARSVIMADAETLWAFAYLHWVEDTRRAEMKERMDRAVTLQTEAQTAMSWLIPELLELPQEKVMGWIESNPALEPFRSTILEAYRRQAHSLDAEGEHLLSLHGSVNTTLSAIYNALTVADARFPEVALSDGRMLRASGSSSWQSVNRDRVQADRRAVHEGYLSVFDRREHSLAALYATVLQRNLATAKARGYDTCLEAILDEFAIPVAVYDTLVETAHEGVEPFRRYHRLRQQFLRLESYHEYDRRVPLVETSFSFAYDEIQKPLLASVLPLGEAYQRGVAEFFSERRIDIYENVGKQPRNFALTAYGFPAFLKLNYGDTIEDAFTFAHEMGHGMHGNLSRRNQPFDTYEYSTFVAETASIFNEALLNDELLRTVEEPELRIALLQYRIDTIAMAFYEIAILADFERRAHGLVERGESVNAEVLQKLYLECYGAVYGDVVGELHLVRNAWSTWVHLFFDTPFYVFQYATSLAAATSLHAQVTSGPTLDRVAAVTRYLELLGAGASDHPVELLRRAGVDLTDQASLGALVERMDLLVTQLERELGIIDGV